MHRTYILRSESRGRYYVGHTNDMVKRLARHNGGQVKSTKPYRPWVLVYSEEYATKNEAFKREMQIKSYKSGEAFKKLVR